MERLTSTALKQIDDIVSKHVGEPGPVIVMLHDVQNELGYIPFEAMDKIAKATGVSAAEVFTRGSNLRGIFALRVIESDLKRSTLGNGYRARSRNLSAIDLDVWREIGGE